MERMKVMTKAQIRMSVAAAGKSKRSARQLESYIEGLQNHARMAEKAAIEANASLKKVKKAVERLMASLRG